jgi:hypothetical protein
MDQVQAGNITLSYLKISDYKELKAAMIDSYRSMAEAYWSEDEIETLLDKFAVHDKPEEVEKMMGDH